MLAAREMKVSWPFGAALRGVASSRRMVPWLKTAVLSDAEKAAVSCQAGTGKANAGEPPLKRREKKTASEPGR